VEAVAPAPVRSAVLPQTRVPEPPNAPAPDVPADFPATRPPAAMPAAIPTTMPPTSTSSAAPDADRTLVDAPDAATEGGADAASRTDDPRLRTLPGFGDPERVGPPRSSESNDPEDPS
jgi:hypothetical protein